MVLGPSDTLLGNCTALWHVENATKYLANYEKHIAAANKLAKEMKSSFVPTFEVEKVQVNGNPALRVEIAISLTMPVPDLNRMMEAMFGPDRKIVAYIAAADEHTIVVGYGSKKTLRRATGGGQEPQDGPVRRGGRGQDGRPLARRRAGRRPGQPRGDHLADQPHRGEDRAAGSPRSRTCPNSRRRRRSGWP